MPDQEMFREVRIVTPMRFGDLSTPDSNATLYLYPDQVLQGLELTGFIVPGIKPESHTYGDKRHYSNSVLDWMVGLGRQSGAQTKRVLAAGGEETFDSSSKGLHRLRWFIRDSEAMIPRSFIFTTNYLSIRLNGIHPVIDCYYDRDPMRIIPRNDAEPYTGDLSRLNFILEIEGRRGAVDRCLFTLARKLRTVMLDPKVEARRIDLEAIKDTITRVRRLPAPVPAAQPEAFEPLVARLEQQINTGQELNRGQLDALKVIVRTDMSDALYARISRVRDINARYRMANYEKAMEAESCAIAEQLQNPSLDPKKRATLETREAQIVAELNALTH